MLNTDQYTEARLKYFFLMNAAWDFQIEMRSTLLYGVDHFLFYITFEPIELTTLRQYHDR